jgi:hypothetical protein
LFDIVFNQTKQKRNNSTSHHIFLNYNIINIEMAQTFDRLDDTTIAHILSMTDPAGLRALLMTNHRLRQLTLLYLNQHDLTHRSYHLLKEIMNAMMIDTRSYETLLNFMQTNRRNRLLGHQFLREEEQFVESYVRQCFAKKYGSISPEKFFRLLSIKPVMISVGQPIRYYSIKLESNRYITDPYPHDDVHEPSNATTLIIRSLLGQFLRCLWLVGTIETPRTEHTRRNTRIIYYHMYLNHPVPF